MRILEDLRAAEKRLHQKRIDQFVSGFGIGPSGTKKG